MTLDFQQLAPQLDQLGPDLRSQAEEAGRRLGRPLTEMRKYNVTLLVVDQRPSAIDGEVMSQVGTKIACLLDNEADVDGALAGVGEKRELCSVLARLESRQQALIFGHALPMAVVARTEEWGREESYVRFARPSLKERMDETVSD